MLTYGTKFKDVLLLIIINVYYFAYVHKRIIIIKTTVKAVELQYIVITEFVIE